MACSFESSLHGSNVTISFCQQKEKKRKAEHWFK
jgi:hypothetical protein